LLCNIAVSSGQVAGNSVTVGQVGITNGRYERATVPVDTLLSDARIGACEVARDIVGDAPSSDDTLVSVARIFVATEVVVGSWRWAISSTGLRVNLTWGIGGAGNAVIARHLSEDALPTTAIVNCARVVIVADNWDYFASTSCGVADLRIALVSERTSCGLVTASSCVVAESNGACAASRASLYLKSATS